MSLNNVWSVYTNCHYCIFIIIGGFMVFNATFNIISVVKNLPSPYNKDLGPLARFETGNSCTPLRSLPDGYKKSHVLHLKAFLMKTKKSL